MTARSEVIEFFKSNPPNTMLNCRTHIPGYRGTFTETHLAICREYYNDGLIDKDYVITAIGRIVNYYVPRGKKGAFVREL